MGYELIKKVISLREQTAASEGKPETPALLSSMHRSQLSTHHLILSKDGEKGHRRKVKAPIQVSLSVSQPNEILILLYSQDRVLFTGLVCFFFSAWLLWSKKGLKLAGTEANKSCLLKMICLGVQTA